MSERRPRVETRPDVFPDPLGDLAHAVIGRAVIRLVDEGYALEAARAIVRTAVNEIIEDFEA